LARPAGAYHGDGVAELVGHGDNSPDRGGVVGLAAGGIGMDDVAIKGNFKHAVFGLIRKQKWTVGSGQFEVARLSWQGDKTPLAARAAQEFDAPTGTSHGHRDRSVGRGCNAFRLLAYWDDPARRGGGNRW
jgi:hypothetical protein